jgi:ribosomal protein S18 acetylase RimI-like enzyme
VQERPEGVTSALCEDGGVETVDVLSPSVADASVRPATPADLPAIGGIHARAWTTSYRDLIPAELLSGVTPEALTQAWRPHLDATSTPLHHLLVACTGPTVVGFAAFGPAEPPAAPRDAELPTLLVDAVHQRRGHGSRLLAAGVDLLREGRVARLICWVPEVDAPRLAFLRSAGFGEDGARRRLALSDEAEDGIAEIRLVAGLDQPG